MNGIRRSSKDDFIAKHIGIHGSDTETTAHIEESTWEVVENHGGEK